MAGDFNLHMQAIDNLIGGVVDGNWDIGEYIEKHKSIAKLCYDLRIHLGSTSQPKAGRTHVSNSSKRGGIIDYVGSPTSLDTRALPTARTQLMLRDKRRDHFPIALVLLAACAQLTSSIRIKTYTGWQPETEDGLRTYSRACETNHEKDVT